MNKKTYFAEAARKSSREVSAEVDLICSNTIVSGLLNTVSGILAVVNDKRQVVAVNDSFLSMLGITDAHKQLGLRPGEILQCIHAAEPPSGCGTTRHCRSCGAAVAMVTSLAEGLPAEQICTLRAMRQNGKVDIVLNVRAQPLEINSSKFLLLFLRDITRQQHQAALERIFFHDINNMMCVLVGASELLVSETSSSLARTVHRSALRLQHEISIQHCLDEGQTRSYTPVWQMTTAEEIFDELESLFSSHPAARGKHLSIKTGPDRIPFKTDLSLIMRILCNMVTNGFEAVEEDGEVKVWFERNKGYLSFCVWNNTIIPVKVQDRIFQRNFSTKEQMGRGLGTFSMQLLGEEILGGRVEFASSRKNGTVFKLNLPDDR